MQIPVTPPGKCDWLRNVCSLLVVCCGWTFSAWLVLMPVKASAQVFHADTDCNKVCGPSLGCRAQCKIDGQWEFKTYIALFDTYIAGVVQSCGSFSTSSNEQVIASAKRMLVNAGVFQAPDIEGVSIRFCLGVEKLGQSGITVAADRILLDPNLKDDPRRLAETLAHEFQHVGQYRTMGTEEFKYRYARFMTECQCHDESHPLEKEVYATASKISAQLDKLAPPGNHRSIGGKRVPLIQGGQASSTKSVDFGDWILFDMAASNWSVPSFTMMIYDPDGVLQGAQNLRAALQRVSIRNQAPAGQVGNFSPALRRWPVVRALGQEPPATFDGFSHSFVNGQPDVTTDVKFVVDAGNVVNFGVEARTDGACDQYRKVARPGKAPLELKVMPRPMDKPLVCNLAIRLCAIEGNPMLTSENRCIN
jgi:hypothetical protein